jgi:hypothetical protein
MGPRGLQAGPHACLPSSQGSIVSQVRRIRPSDPAGSGRKLELPDQLRYAQRPNPPRLQNIAPNCPKIARSRPKSRPASGISGVPAKPPDRIRHALQTEIEPCSSTTTCPPCHHLPATAATTCPPRHHLTATSSITRPTCHQLSATSSTTCPPRHPRQGLPVLGWRGLQAEPHIRPNAPLIHP